jgi:hypothetical protein
MSSWTYITGIITVSPMGRTQPEKRYILDTVLEHQPRVTGSEQDMHIHVVQKHGYNCSSSHNEFGEWIPWNDNHTQSDYFVIIEGTLRDRHFDETLRELSKWLNRLAKRAGIEDLIVKLTGYDSKWEWRELIISNSEPYEKMAEWPSWVPEKSNGEPMWCEYMMWDSAKDANYPMLLAYKYFNDPENDAEVERRMEYSKGDH